MNDKAYKIAFDMWGRDIRNTDGLNDMAKSIIIEAGLTLEEVDKMLEKHWVRWEDTFYAYAQSSL